MFLKRLFKKNGNGDEKFAERNQPCYDKNGKFLGWFSRSIASVLFVFCKDKDGSLYVLASERGTGAADFQGYWNCPCGYLDFGEKIASSACRELKEECGVEADPNKIVMFGYEDSPSANHQNVTFRFTCLIDDRTIDEIKFSKDGNEKNEVGEIKWVPIGEIDAYKWAFGHEKRIHEAIGFLGLKLKKVKKIK